MPGTLAAPRGVVLLRAAVDQATIDDAGIVLPPAREQLEAYAVVAAEHPPVHAPDPATFAATLELAKEGKIEIRQGEIFAPIHIRKKVPDE